MYKYNEKYNKYKLKYYSLQEQIGGVKECVGKHKTNDVRCNIHENWINCVSDRKCDYKSNFLSLNDILQKAPFSVTSWNTTQLFDFIKYNTHNFANDDDTQIQPMNGQDIQKKLEDNQITGSKILDILQNLNNLILFHGNNKKNRKRRKEKKNELFSKFLPSNLVSYYNPNDILKYLFGPLYIYTQNKTNHHETIRTDDNLVIYWINMVSKYVNSIPQIINNNRSYVTKKLVIYIKKDEQESYDEIISLYESINIGLIKKVRFIIIPVIIQINKEITSHYDRYGEHIDHDHIDAHANVLIFDTTNKQIRRFEPHGSSTTAYEFEEIDNSIKNILTQCIDEFEYYDPSLICPNIIIGKKEKGIQHLEEYMSRDSMCVSWTYAYIIYVMLHPEKTHDDIQKDMMGGLQISDKSVKPDTEKLAILLYQEIERLNRDIILTNLLINYNKYKDYFEEYYRPSWHSSTLNIPESISVNMDVSNLGNSIIYKFIGDSDGFFIDPDGFNKFVLVHNDIINKLKDDYQMIIYYEGIYDVLMEVYNNPTDFDIKTEKQMDIVFNFFDFIIKSDNFIRYKNYYNKNTNFKLKIMSNERYKLLSSLERLDRKAAEIVYGMRKNNDMWGDLTKDRLYVNLPK